MAVLLQLTVSPVTRDQFHELETQVEESMMQDVLRPLLAQLSLAASDTTVRPVWSYASP